MSGATIKLCLNLESTFSGEAHNDFELAAGNRRNMDLVKGNEESEFLSVPPPARRLANGSNPNSPKWLILANKQAQFKPRDYTDSDCIVPTTTTTSGGKGG